MKVVKPDAIPDPGSDTLGNSADTPIPAWILAPYEEKEVRRRCQEQAEAKCKDFFIKFGECAKNHQILFSIKCKEQKTALLECVGLWGSATEFDKLRAAYVAEKKEILRQELQIVAEKQRSSKV